MAILGNTQINALFLQFQHQELTYTPEVAASLGLRAGSANLRVSGQVHPCLVHSLSFSAARLILRVPDSLVSEFRDGSRLGVLKMSFQAGINSSVDEFTLSGKTHIQSHRPAPGGGKDVLFLVRLDFNHRPPEGFIEIQGRYLKLKSEAEHRKDIRLAVDDSTLRSLGLKSSRGDMVIDNIPRKVVLREVSYGGSTVIIGGIAKFLGEKDFSLGLELISGQGLVLPGRIVRAAPLEDYKAMAVLGLAYDQDRIPKEYLELVQRGLAGKGGSVAPKRQAPSPAVAYVDTSNLKIKRGQ